MEKQSSIEWFAEMVAQMRYVNIDILEQAKSMHKEEIIAAYDCGKEQPTTSQLCPIDYYEQTFNNDPTN